MDSEASSPTVEISLTAPVYGGECLGRLPDGRAAFVPYTLPGERVRMRVTEEKRGHVRGECIEILQPSPLRVQPFCLHYGQCGGCHYQHMPYSEQLSIKAEILRDQLVRIGGLVHPDVRPTRPSPNPVNYRNHIQFHLTPDGQLGYLQPRSKKLMPVKECYLPEPAINQLWPQLVFDPGQSIERIGIRCGLEDDLQVLLESKNSLPPDFLVEDLDISAVYLSPAGSLVLAGSETIFMQVLDKVFQVSAGSFFQVNSSMAGAMVRHILDEISALQPITPHTTLLDIFCGVGLFSSFLAEKAGRVIGIETSPSAADDFVANLDAFDHIELYEAEAEIVLPELKLKADIALLDPPRSGIHLRALEGLLDLNIPLLVYISCDPATLGRDAKRLVSGGYQLAHVTPFDMFPHTYHIESISFWVRP